ncbi:hypothetical protein [Tissierella sp.]|uniref:hypothetical protein n=1 Tax=Tissierella sp. TaxID=41274 RepID=UPI002858BC82|nr:hypothetical protein [Tissierella sp.]MDR7856017.1 hypothetical protein [Tissierella sp.]
MSIKKRKRREPRLLNCIILNPIEDTESQEFYDDLVFGALATALKKCLTSSQIKQIISQIEGAD